MGARLREHARVCTRVFFHVHSTPFACVHLHVHERDQRLERERAFEQKEKLPEVKEVYTADSRSCSIYKNSKNRHYARARVCFDLSPRTSRHVSAHACVKINKTHTIEGFLLFGSRGRGSYFVVH